MLNYWTFQRKELVQKLKATGKLVPNFKNSKNITGSDIRAYNYILDKYNSITNNSYDGLIFGLICSSEFPIVDNIDTLYKMLESAGYPGGSYFPPETHDLLHIILPEKTVIMPIDFYKFSDLMYFMSDDGKYDSDDIEKDIQISKQYLFEPNLPDGKWQLIVGHLPYIDIKQVKQIYSPRSI